MSPKLQAKIFVFVIRVLMYIAYRSTRYQNNEFLQFRVEEAQIIEAIGLELKASEEPKTSYW
jgi:hypothetical protein